MFRRCVTAVLIFSYLATGLAAVPHAHASQLADHGARPHVHSDWIVQLFAWIADSAEHHVSHHDHHHGHHHHDAADGHGHSHEVPCDEPGSTPEPMHHSDQHHDSTCVYVEYRALAVSSSGGSDDQSRVIAQVALLDVIAHNLTVSTLSRPAWAHAPPGSLVAGSDLILKLRTLRI